VVGLLVKVTGLCLIHSGARNSDFQGFLIHQPALSAARIEQSE
jgi:hypothetical protein